MSDMALQLKSHYATKCDEELMAFRLRDDLTEIAYQVLDEMLVARGISKEAIQQYALAIAPTSPAESVATQPVIDTQAPTGSDSDIIPPKILLWEKIAIWLILLISVVLSFIPQMYILIANHTLVIEGLQQGSLSPFSLIMPFLLLAAAVLLVRLNKWCLPFFVVHLIGSIAFVAYYYTFSALPWYFLLGYILEIACISLAIRLLGRKILK